MKELIAPRLTRFHLKDMKPGGWLLKQLRLQAEGLSGNLDKFWPDIKDSRWIGGDREGWERLPYWLDGFIPLAYLLENEDMMGRADKYITSIIQHQDKDGWLCPCPASERSHYDVWALFLVLKVLVQYQEITEDRRIEEVVRKALICLDRHIDGNLLFGWAQSRWFECLISIWWLYERTEEEWLLHLASKLHSQGFDWIGLFKHWPYRTPDEKGRWSQMSHVVNTAMALKSGALYSRMTGDEEELNSAAPMVELLDRYHGMVTGAFTGDECLAGNSPIQGTELCAIAEYMYSLEQLISVTGNPIWADRLELLAYNALPAAFSPDMWSHQYVQQVNQVECSLQKEPVFLTNGGEANLFGLEPNFGCCTANLSQPWPKFALNTIQKAEDGIAVLAYAPMTVHTAVQDTGVSIIIDTEYPFRETVNITVKTLRPVCFALYLRLPDWCGKAVLSMGEERYSLNEAVGTDKGFYCLSRTWDNETNMTLSLPMNLKLVERPNHLYAVLRGPLVYSLAIEENWVQINKDIRGREFPHCDYEVYAASPWNYGLRIDPSAIIQGIHVVNKETGEIPFSPEGAPIVLKVRGSKIHWPQVNGSAGPAPGMDWISEETEELTMLPYGCSNLRLTEMPVL